MKYLVNFIIDQKFSEIVEAKDKDEAIEKAKVYLQNRFVELKYESMKNNLDSLISDKLNTAKDAIEEMQK